MSGWFHSEGIRRDGVAYGSRKEQQVSIPVEPKRGSLRRLARVVGNDGAKARTVKE